MRPLFVEVDLTAPEAEPPNLTRLEFLDYVRYHRHDRMGCWLLAWEARYVYGAISSDELRQFQP